MINHYIAYGPVRGECGHMHKTREAAEACAERDQAAIRRAYPSTFPTRAYSDRDAVACDEHGKRIAEEPEEDYDLYEEEDDGEE